MKLEHLLFFISEIWSLGIGVAVLLRSGRSPARWAFAFGMILLAAEGFFARAAVPETAAEWQCLRYFVASFLPAVWLLFSLCYSRGNYREFVVKWWALLALSCALPAIEAIWFQQIAESYQNELVPEAPRILVLGWPAKVLDVVFVIYAVLVLANLERTFRTAVGTMRWRIKFVVLGLGLLFAVRIYTSSQALLYSATYRSLEVFNAGALLLACLLITVSIFRAGPFSVELYPSQTLLHNSLTALLAGAYLFIVGAFAKLVVALGGDASFPIKSFLILVSIVFLTVVLASDRVQLVTRRFVSRHFQRPLHDYRRVWRSFTERATSRVEETDLCREAVNLVSETLQALSVTIWLIDEKQGRFVLGASTSVAGNLARELVESGKDISRLVEMMRRQPDPINIDEAKEGWVEELRRYNPEYFRKGGKRICVPLLAKGEFLGLLAVGDRVSGVPFSVEDTELLKCVGDQIASLLLNIQLSQRVLQAKEMEAFQQMAAFFIHDLKNTASSLSLVLQNLPAQFDNQEFRQDALRAVSKGVARINELIKRLSSLRETVQMHPTDADLNEVVTAAIHALGKNPNVIVKQLLSPLPDVLMDPEQIQKVVTNLLLNASEAMDGGGEITVETAQQNGWAVLCVRDKGCGMSPEFVRSSLFRPFQTSKKRGMGIGMFHSKMIVEAHQGRIEVETEQGKGTTFRVLLPLPGGAS